MWSGLRDRARLRRALPHLVGAYAVAGLLTGAFLYGKVPFAPYDARMTAAVHAGALWPAYWLVRTTRKAYHAIAASLP